MKSVLTPEQVAFFEENGYILVSGLTPEAIVAAATIRLEQEMKEKYPTAFFGTQAANDCYTETLCAAAAELGGEGDIKPYFPIRGALAIITYPSEGEWQWPPPHLDHSIPKDGHHTFPRPYRLASLFYLSEIAKGGGGTVVWPGSHRKLETLAKSDPERYTLMTTLNNDIALAGLSEPVELTPSPGDILFYHYLTAHAGSKNVTDQPRLALNHKW